MRADQRPPTVGILAALSYVVLVVLPYLTLSEREVGGVAFYYSHGIAGPQFLSILALVAIVLFAAGRQRRTEPDYVAGLTLVLGAVLAILVLGWAVSVPESVVAGLGTAAWLDHHRWLLSTAALAMVASAVWYARALSLV